MRKFSVLIALLTLFCTISSSQEKIFYKHNNIQVSGKNIFSYHGVLEYPTEDQNQVILTKYYPNGVPMSRTFYFDYKNKIKHNVQMLFKDNGQLAKTISYNYDSLHGPIQYYDSQGVIVARELYESNELVYSESKDNVEVSIKEKFRNIQDMPVFEGCEGFLDEGKRNRCSLEKLYKIIEERSIYSEEAAKKGVKGIVYVSCLVDEHGKVINPSIIARSMESAMFDTLCINVVSSLPDFIPGTEYGEPSSIQLNLRFSFYPKDRDGELKLNTYYFDNGWSSIGRELRERGIKTQEVDRMPIWKGCESKGFDETEDDCTEWRIERYIRKNVIYPSKFKKQDLREGVLVRFTVSKEGKTENIKLVKKSEFEEFNEEASRVVASLPKFIPAKRGEETAAYDFCVNVNFRNW